MTGVGEAKLFLACFRSGLSMWNSSMSCRMFPYSRSTQIARNDLPPSSAVCIQIWLDSTTGEDQPSPGIANFHLTWAVSLQVRGKWVESEIPSPVGPRNCGQFSDA